MMDDFTNGYWLGSLVTVMIVFGINLLAPDSFESKRVVTEIAADHVVLDDCFYIDQAPPKTLQIGDTVNFYTK